MLHPVVIQKESEETIESINKKLVSNEKSILRSENIITNRVTITVLLKYSHWEKSKWQNQPVALAGCRLTTDNF